ncbi:MAG: hypothetical protein WA936_13490 [Erythrobacter sp.]|uniref:DUF3617 domain-containing protein n=1 Tax=Erythrobacter sp. TaxID=1042 RepID=UPI003C74C529
MKRSNRTKLSIAAIALSAWLVPLAGPVVAQSADLPMLSQLAGGEWTVRFRDGSASRKICVRSGAELIQLRHRGSGCSRFVVENEANRVTVQYTCPGNGYGRTSVRRETNSLVQIESQGISNGVPFQLTAEARRTGGC